jgi:SAM-dependent methyltransferase
MNRFHQRKQPNTFGQKRVQASKTGWEQASNWYGEHMGDEDSILNTVVYPAVLKLLAPKKDSSYLDIACGEGAFSRVVATAGAKMSGFDASPTLIDRAKKMAPTHADYRVADAVNFGKNYPSRVFDGATCLLAIQNIDRPESVFKNANQVLKNGAPLIVVMNHPSFRVPRQSSWGYEEARQIQYRRIDMYMSNLKIPILTHPGANSKIKTISFHHPLSFYINALGNAGFAVTASEELVSNRLSDSGPRAKAENRARREFPMFLAIRAIKIN